nr:4-galactosyl-N-acetylglucosaminide 3-alpha-L-fucosyltransferase 9 [Nothobranchius furzeri]
MTTTTTNKILRPLFTTVFIVMVFIIIFMLYVKPSSNFSYNQVEPTSLKNGAKRVPKTNTSLTIVLVWHWPFGQTFKLDNCSSAFNIKDCFITADKNLYNRSHGVIFHHRDIARDLSNLPQQQRPPFQKWIWMNLESPSHSPQLSGINNLFNVTLNYRQDSDIKGTYGIIVPTKTAENFVPPKKDKLVCWIVSNWNPGHRRVQYFNELHKHIEIHTYGQAFRNKISGEDYMSIMTSCKFYLSFENSIHKDYITEKMYNPLAVGTVPVVLGTSRQNYENFIQGDSFIHVDDFKSPKELAEYLLIANKNEQMYLGFFKWRQNFKSHNYGSWSMHTCHACEYLQKHKEYKAINDLNKWYWG